MKNAVLDDVFMVALLQLRLSEQNSLGAGMLCFLVACYSTIVS